MAEIGVAALPFAVVRCPRLKLSTPSVSLPSAMTVFAAVFFSYFLVLSGIIYDMINEPPSVGAELDPATGKQRPVAILKYRINGQYIIEGMSAGFLFCLGALGFILLDRSASKSLPSKVRSIMLIAGVVCIGIAYNMCMVFLRIKMPGYMN